MKRDRSQKADWVRLQHMADAIEEALEFMAEKSLEEFESNRLLILAIAKEIEVLGEAANQISAGFRRSEPNVPWSELVEMRNEMIHMYFVADVPAMWATVRTEFPKLQRSLVNLLERRLPGPKRRA